jgi:hypothetical protein
MTYVPGEEAAVIGTKSGVVLSHVTYTRLLDKKNPWRRLEPVSDDQDYKATVCSFNSKGTFLAVGFDVGAVELWMVATVHLKCRTLMLPETVAAAYDDYPLPKPGKRPEAALWCCVALAWAPDNRHIVAAYNHSDYAKVAQPGLLVLWSVTDGSVVAYVRQPTWLVHIALSPVTRGRCLVSCYTGHVRIIDFSLSDDEDDGSCTDCKQETLLWDPNAETDLSTDQSLLSTSTAAATAAAGAVDSTAKAKPKPVTASKAGRALWSRDGSTAYILTYTHQILAVAAQHSSSSSSKGAPAVLARCEFNTVSPSTFELTADGDALLLSTNRGICLVPTDTLDVGSAQFFGERQNRYNAKQYFGTCTAGDIEGQGRLSVIGNASMTRQEKGELLVYHVDADGKVSTQDSIIHNVCSLLSLHRYCLVASVDCSVLYFLTFYYCVCSVCLQYLLINDNSTALSY